MEEIDREKKMKNMKEIAYIKISSYDIGEWAKLQKIKKPKNDHKIPINQEKMRKLLSPRK